LEQAAFDESDCSRNSLISWSPPSSATEELPHVLDASPQIVVDSLKMLLCVANRAPKPKSVRITARLMKYHAVNRKRMDPKVIPRSPAAGINAAVCISRRCPPSRPLCAGIG
jgi:hypothetical protein